MKKKAIIEHIRKKDEEAKDQENIKEIRNVMTLKLMSSLVNEEENLKEKKYKKKYKILKNELDELKSIVTSIQFKLEKKKRRWKKSYHRTQKKERWRS